MKKIFENLWIQLLLSIISSLIGAVMFAAAAFAFYVKYAGLLFAGGDNSPVTHAISVIFAILIFFWPFIVGINLIFFGKAKALSRIKKIIILITFVTLPLWIYVGIFAIQKTLSYYREYQSIREICDIKDGVNTSKTNKGSAKFECQRGILNGLYQRFNDKEMLVWEANYKNGKLDGWEKNYSEEGTTTMTHYVNGKREGDSFFYNSDGSLHLYILNENGKDDQIYYQISENNLLGDIKPESQKYLCRNREKYVADNKNSFECKEGVIDGEYVKGLNSSVVYKIRFKSGVLDGRYEEVIDGKTHLYLEFKEGKLNGQVKSYSSDGKLEYEGQYENGLQQGVFRRYGYLGNIESEVEFANGQIIKVTRH